MTLATYTDLVAQIDGADGWLRRDDQTARIPVYVKLAEGEMNRMIRSRRKIGRNATFSIDAEFVAVPPDFGGIRTLRLVSGTGANLEFITPEQMARLKDGQQAQAGEPQVYSVVGDEFEFGPSAPDATYTAMLTYLQAIPGLEANGTNWLMTDHPDLYLHGALWKGFEYAKAIDMAQAHETEFMRIVDEINAASIAESTGGVIRPYPNTQAI